MRQSSIYRRLMWPRVVKVPMKRGPFFVENGYPLVVGENCLLLFYTCFLGCYFLNNFWTVFF